VNPYYAHVLIMFFFYAYLALAWNIVGGYAGQLSLGHAVFYGLGAYTSTLLFLHLQLSPWLGMVAGGALAAMVSVLIGYPTFRLRGPFFAMSTLAVLEVFRILTVYFSDLTGGSTGLSIPIRFGLGSLVFQGKAPYLAVVVGLFALAVVVSILIERSRFGHRLVALRENEDAAESCGVNVRRVKLTATVLSASLTAIAGSFYAQYVLYIDPSGEFSLDLSVVMAMMAILGGAGTVLGPILGAAVLAPLQEVLRAWLGGKAQGLHLIIYGILIIAVVKFLPRGILAWLRSLASGLRARPAAPPAREAARGSDAPARLRPAGAARRPDVPLLAVRGLRKAFGGLVAVNGVDLEVKAGEILSVIGPNGAGKTTLFNLLSGVYRPDAGAVRYEGVDVTGFEPHEACRRGIARTFQIPKPFAEVTALENVVVGALSRTASAAQASLEAEEILAFVGLADRRDTLASSLTPGDQKRLELARALATGPSLLMLDELMAGLTPTELREAMDVIGRIRGLGVTVLLVEHVMQVVMQISDRVVVLHHGEKIAEGSPAVVAADERVVTAYLGDEYAVA
jgi:branched-chain amino acid transport system permease protein